MVTHMETTQHTDTTRRVLASGAVALLDAGKVYWIGSEEDAAWEQECHEQAGAIYCSVCDGAGHGQPGYGPCPLENTGDYSSEPWWAQ